jgi:LmbE family N-acetylglucosaminyl deacetylase
MKPPANLTHQGYRLLIAFAHPDDESFGMGGAIAYYVRHGAEVSLICSTNGDVGTVAAEHLNGYTSVSELRLAELQCAAGELGLKEVIAFGYRDSGMMGSPDNNNPDCLWQADEDGVTGRIVREIRRIRPQVVVTFDPFGGYGHPDHIVMHRATTRAVDAAGNPAQYPEHLAEGLDVYRPARLYYTAFPRLPLQWFIWRARLRGEDPRHMGTNKDLDLQEALDRQLPTHARINVGQYQAAWDAAAGCHASQQNLRQQSGRWDALRRLIFRHQDFTRAWPEPQPGERRERDLFQGIPKN